MFEENSQKKDEAIFGIAMLALLSLWVVFPSLFTAYKLFNNYNIQSKILLLLCSIQGFIIICTLLQ